MGLAQGSGSEQVGDYRWGSGSRLRKQGKYQCGAIGHSNGSRQVYTDPDERRKGSEIDTAAADESDSLCVGKVQGQKTERQL